MNTPIKHGVYLLGTTLLLAVQPAFAVDGSDTTEKYRAKEMSLDLFGSGSIGQHTINNITGLRVDRDLRLGAGLGMNYFVTRGLGFGLEGYTENVSHSFVDNGSASVIGRFPLGQSGFAPYIYGGGGRKFDPAELWFAQAGAGLEFRCTPQLGFFIDARYVFTEGTKNFGLGRLGVRFAF